MAMIQCPECGKEVSDKASSCPNCGIGIKKNKKKNIGIISGVVIAFILLVTGLLFVNIFFIKSEYTVQYYVDKNIENVKGEIGNNLTINYIEEYQNNTEVGTVLAQSIDSGSVVDKGEIITLTISLGNQPPTLEEMCAIYAFQMVFDDTNMNIDSLEIKTLKILEYDEKSITISSLINDINNYNYWNPKYILDVEFSCDSYDDQHISAREAVVAIYEDGTCEWYEKGLSATLSPKYLTNAYLITTSLEQQDINIENVLANIHYGVEKEDIKELIN